MMIMVRLIEECTTTERNRDYNGKINRETYHYRRESWL